MADQVETVKERTTQKFTLTLKDESGALIPGTSLTTCTLTLYDLASGAVINSREDVNVKPNVSEQGVLTFTFVPADNVVLNDALDFEPHVALFEWTYNGADGRGHWELVMNVRNAEKVA